MKHGLCVIYYVTHTNNHTSNYSKIKPFIYEHVLSDPDISVHFGLSFFLILTEDMFTDFRKKEGGRSQTDRETCKRETLTGCLPYVPRPGIELITFWCTGLRSNQLTHLARAIISNIGRSKTIYIPYSKRPTNRPLRDHIMLY